MLVLSRKKGEKIIIQCGSERIILSVCSVEGKRARLGVEASPHVLIHREEVQEKIDGNNS